MTNSSPTIRKIAWAATIPQLVILAGCVLLAVLVVKPLYSGIVLGCAVYLIYSFLSKSLLALFHRRGISLSNQGKYTEAIGEFEKSYSFFSDHAWLDRYRSVFLLDSSAFSYREMALMNIAFCYGQMGDKQHMKTYYQRTFDEFPENTVAASALQTIVSAESNES